MDTDSLASNCLNAMAQNPRAMSYFIHRGAEMERRRTPLKTSHGHLGTGSQYIAVGHLVALIFGVAMPLVLRRHQEGQYQVAVRVLFMGLRDGRKWTGMALENFNLV